MSAKRGPAAGGPAQPATSPKDPVVEASRQSVHRLVQVNPGLTLSTCILACHPTFTDQQVRDAVSWMASQDQMKLQVLVPPPDPDIKVLVRLWLPEDFVEALG